MRFQKRATSAPLTKPDKTPRSRVLSGFVRGVGVPLFVLSLTP
jgi:hypothetical protein